MGPAGMINFIVAANVRGFVAQIKRARTSLSGFARTTRKSKEEQLKQAKATRKQVKDTKRHTTAMRKQVSVAGALRRSFFGLKAALVAIGTVVGGGMLFKSFLNVAASMERLQMSLEKLTLGKGEETFKALNKWARDMPVDTEKAIDAFRLLRAYHLKPTLKDMTVIVDTVSALGGGRDILEGIARALGQISAKGRPMQQEMNQLAERGVPSLQILQEKLGLAAHQVADIGRQGLKSTTVIKALIEGMEEWAGGLSKMYMKTWYGLGERLKSWITEFKRVVMMSGPFQVLKNSLEEFLQYLETQAGQEALTKWVGNITSLFLTGFQAAITGAYAFAKSLNYIVIGVTKIIQVFNELLAILDIFAEKTGLKKLKKILDDYEKQGSDWLTQIKKFGTMQSLNPIEIFKQSAEMEKESAKVLKSFIVKNLERRAKENRRLLEEVDRRIAEGEDPQRVISRLVMPGISYDELKNKIAEYEGILKQYKDIEPINILTMAEKEGNPFAKRAAELQEFIDKASGTDKELGKIYKSLLGKIDKARGISQKALFSTGKFTSPGMTPEAWIMLAKNAKVTYENMAKTYGMIDEGRFRDAVKRQKEETRQFIKNTQARIKFMTTAGSSAEYEWQAKMGIDIKGLTQKALKEDFAAISLYKDELNKVTNQKEFDDLIDKMYVQPWVNAKAKVVGLPTGITKVAWKEFEDAMSMFKTRVKGATTKEELQKYIEEMTAISPEIGKHIRIEGGPSTTAEAIKTTGVENKLALQYNLAITRDILGKGNQMVAAFNKERKYLGVEKIDIQKQQLEQTIKDLKEGLWKEEEIRAYNLQELKKIYSQHNSAYADFQNNYKTLGLSDLEIKKKELDEMRKLLLETDPEKGSKINEYHVEKMREAYERSNTIVSDFYKRRKYLGLDDIQIRKIQLNEGIKLLRESGAKESEIMQFYSEEMKKIHNDSFEEMRGQIETYFDFFSDALATLVLEGRVSFKNLANAFLAMLVKMQMASIKVDFMKGVDEASGGLLDSLKSGFKGIFGIFDKIELPSLASTSLSGFPLTGEGDAIQQATMGGLDVISGLKSQQPMSHLPELTTAASLYSVGAATEGIGAAVDTGGAAALAGSATALTGSATALTGSSTALTGSATTLSGAGTALTSAITSMVSSLTGAATSLTAAATALSSAAAALTGAASTSAGTAVAGLSFAKGGWIDEPVTGIGLRTGKSYTIGEKGAELVLNKEQVNSLRKSVESVKIPVELDYKRPKMEMMKMPMEMKSKAGSEPKMVVNIQNNTNTETEVEQTSPRWDGEKWVLGIVLKAAKENTGGFARHLSTMVR